MSFDTTPSQLESVHIQRDSTNSFYEQINISGSDLIIYHSSSGELTADKISVWAAKYGIGGGGINPGGSYDISASYASSSLSSSVIPYNGNRAIKRDDPDFQGLNVGGSTVTEFLDNFFFPFIPATVSITTPSSTVYYETGSVQTRTVTSTITANDETSFGTGSVTRDSLTWNTIAAIPPLTPSFSDTNISSSHTYKTFVQVDNDGSPTVITSTARSVSFIFPYLYGLSSTEGLSGTSLYTTMVSKSLTTQQDKADYFWGTGTYIYFCYPASYANLTSILDPNSFEVLSSFEHSASVPITSSGLTTNWMNLYHVYRLKLLANPNGYFRFIY